MNSSKKILIVDDEQDLCDILQFNLTTAGYDVDAVHSAEDALQLDLTKYHLLILDVMMEKMSGFELAAILKENPTTTQIPIIFLTAKDTEDDKLEGFNLGADDYLKKPFAIPELVARMKYLLGRKQPSREETQETYTIGEYRFSPESAQLLHTPTREITLLPRREADILQLLCKGGGSIIPTQNILLSLWGDDDFFNARSLQVLITRLRRALSKDPRIRIVNVRGTGYKLFAE